VHVLAACCVRKPEVLPLLKWQRQCKVIYGAAAPAPERAVQHGRASLCAEWPSYGSRPCSVSLPPSLDVDETQGILHSLYHTADHVCTLIAGGHWLPLLPGHADAKHGGVSLRSHGQEPARCGACLPMY